MKSILLPYAGLAIPSADKLHPRMRNAVLALADIALQVDHLGCIGMVGEGSALAKVKDLVMHHGNGVYTVPYLCPDYCRELVHVFELAGYEVNADEPVPAQIPEIVLEQRSKPLYDCLAQLWEHVGVPLAQCLWNLNPASLASVQAAQYTADESPGTALHHDAESDVTLVINLGTAHVGGGTEIAAGLFTEGFVVPSIPMGHGLFFLGKTMLHRGLPVTSGTRTLLVHWSNLI